MKNLDQKLAAALFFFIVLASCLLSSCGSTKTLSLDDVKNTAEISYCEELAPEQVRKNLKPGMFQVHSIGKDSILFQHSAEVDFLVKKVKSPSTTDGLKALKKRRRRGQEIFFWHIRRITQLPEKVPVVSWHMEG